MWRRRTVKIVTLAALLLAPLAARAASGGEAPPGYAVVNVTEFGRAVSAQKRGVASVPMALQATLRDLTAYFGTRPTVKGAYEDVRDHQSGNAVFFADVGGQATKGFIFCKIGRAGASVAVIYGRPDMPPAEWNRLGSAPGQAGASPAGSSASLPTPAHAALKEYRFPDGSGSIGLAEGWHSNSPSCIKGFAIEGPADQLITDGLPYSVVTPDSPIRTARSPLVAPITTPFEAFKILAPQLSRMSASRGGPTITVDDLVERIGPAPGGTAMSVVSFALTESRPDGQRHYKALALVRVMPLSRTGWLLTLSILRAQAATFDRDLPLMMQMSRSLRENAQVVAQKSRQQANAQQQWFAGQQQRFRQQQQSFDNYLNAQERASNGRMRQADDFDEAIRGYRTVEDTRTGERASVDLGDVDRVVDQLNQHGPSHYRQIPLRDEADPRR